MAWYLEGVGKSAGRKPTEVALFRRRDGKEIGWLAFHGKLYRRKRVRLFVRIRTDEDLDQRFEIRIRPKGYRLASLYLIREMARPVRFETRLPTFHARALTWK